MMAKKELSKHELNLMLERKRLLERRLEIIHYKKDYRRYFSECLYIKDKQAQIVSFNINIGQEKIVKIVEEWKIKYSDPKTRPTLYVIILKARQIGYSTCVEAVIFHDLTMDFNRVGMVISYDEDSAKNINDMSNRYYQYLPTDMKPLTRGARGKGIMFENPSFDPYKPASEENNPGLQSKFLIDTANNTNAGSSYTINYLHLSELAKWKGDIKSTMTSLLQSVPQFNSIVFIESTACGFNYFKDIWDDAVDRRNDYVPVFTSWMEHDEYQIPLNADEVLDPLDEEELDLINIHEASLPQLKWRRWCIKNKCSNDVNQFHQEYPTTPEEAFLSTGTPVFDNQVVNKRLAEVRKNVKYTAGSMIYEYKDQMIVNESIRFSENSNGFIKVFKQPVPGRPYVIGSDTAEGGFDMSSGQVLDNITGEQVARWWGHCETGVLARELYCLGAWYNWALIAIEINFDKHPVKELARLKYPKQYLRETLDKIADTITDQYGFLTTQITRPIIIGNLVEIVNTQPHLFNDEDTLKEMLTMVRNDMGKPDHLAGKRNDLVLGAAIGHQSRNQQSFHVEQKPADKPKGWYTRDELEDMGYSQYEIDELMLDQRPWEA